jgi:hypothetical protein
MHIWWAATVKTGVCLTLLVPLTGCTSPRSILSGTWASAHEMGKVPNVIVRIRDDGSFDWSQTLTGRLGPAGRLRRAGHSGRGPWHPEQRFSVVWNDYEEAHSRVLLLWEFPGTDGEPQFELTYHDAMMDGSDTLLYRRLVMASSGKKPLKQCAETLYRSDARSTPEEPCGCWKRAP